MPPAIQGPDLSEAASAEHWRSLSELPQFYGRIAQYQNEFVVFRHSEIAPKNCMQLKMNRIRNLFPQPARLVDYRYITVIGV